MSCITIPDGFTRADLLECVERELGLRDRVYPRQVGDVCGVEAMRRCADSFAVRYPAWSKMFFARIRAAEAADNWPLEVALMREFEEKHRGWLTKQRATLAQREAS